MVIVTVRVSARSGVVIRARVRVRVRPVLASLTVTRYSDGHCPAVGLV